MLVLSLITAWDKDQMVHGPSQFRLLFLILNFDFETRHAQSSRGPRHWVCSVATGCPMGHVGLDPRPPWPVATHH